MIHLTIKNYTKPYCHLNGEKKQNIKPLDLARGIIMTGQRTWSDTFKLGIFRLGELICKTLAFTTVDNGKLVLRDRFSYLNQSEKATISYYFGQGFTKLYAESFLNIPWLLHIDDMGKNVSFYTKGSATSKTTVGLTKKIAGKPDLIGIESTHVSHIFEAKGSSVSYDSGVMQHAINQVSQINSYNGIAPKTRTACFYNLSKSPIKGIIIDPEDNDNGISIELNEEAAIKDYYSFFLENRQYFNNTFRYGGNVYLITQVAVPNVYIGFDKRLLELKPKMILEERLFWNTNIVREDAGRGEISLGLDGIILIIK